MENIKFVVHADVNLPSMVDLEKLHSKIHGEVTVIDNSLGRNTTVYRFCPYSGPRKLKNIRRRADFPTVSIIQENTVTSRNPRMMIIGSDSEEESRKCCKDMFEILSECYVIQ